ncbi:neural cell adhesion molecule 1-like isoform X2 [Paramuricea clavata]|uniref:Neural cell adhesion molecule 1-like isoform X2 n=1 Tax=Paramuricea clavata TaxID=317549 RepID=A0A6S7IXB1_PARCT|nr:neural cell adhesion molecule 1-like isoform X2 [Paramuricea clavata]
MAMYTNMFIHSSLPGPLKNINDVSATGNTVTVYWPQAAKSVDKYIIKYRIKGSSDDWKEKETEKIFIEIPGLDDGETYEFQVFYEDAGKEMVYTEIREFSVPSVTTTAPAPAPTPTRKTAPPIAPKTDEKPKGTGQSPPPSPPGKVARKKGLSGGAIAAIVIVIILLVLIAVDIFCCFFNQCGVTHMCAAACAGKKREKYNVDGSPEEGTKLKERDEDGKEDPEV